MQVKDTNRSRRSVSLLALVCLVLQLALAPNVALGNGRANFAYILAALVALTVGGRTGVGVGFAAGLAFDLSTTGPIALMAFLLTAVSFLLGNESRDRLADDPLSSLVLALMGALGVSLAYSLVMCLLGQAGSLLDAVLLRALPTALLTALFYLPIAFLLGRGRAAGGPRHVGRYTMDRR